MLELILIVGAAALLLAYWPEIVAWCTYTVAPWIETELGSVAASLFRTLVRWLDSAVVLTIRALQEAWLFVGRNVLRLERRYERLAVGRVLRTSESIVATEHGTAIRRVERQELAWEELPSNVRDQMIRRPRDRAIVDVRTLLEERLRERITEESLELTLEE